MTPSAPVPSSLKNDGHASIGLAPLMRQALAGVDLKPLGTSLIEYSTSHPDDAHALMDLSTILLLTGNRELALATQMEALKLQQIYHVPSAEATKLKLLALVTPGDLMANTPVECLLENSDVSLELLYLGAGVPALPYLPEHDIMFVAVGESDENRRLLKELERIVKDWPRPVLNRPEFIARLARDEACALLQPIDGLVMPMSVRAARQSLQKIGNGELAVTDLLEDGGYPIIVRPVGSHAGKGLEKIDSANALADYLQAEPSAEFYIARFIDYRSEDGQFRKYRVMLIEGRPFICHMAISAHWMIHYLNAGMADSADKRAEEQRFMATFEKEFVPRHREALWAIAERIGLGYVGIDCGETPDGKLVVFEVDSDMIVHAMDPVDLFPYKQPQMRKLFRAFRAALAEAADSCSA